MSTNSPQLLQLLNQLPEGDFARMMATSPNLKNWVNANNYQHPSMMKNIQANYQNQPVPSPVSNLGMSGQPNQMIPHPLAPSARVSAGGQMISPTPSVRGIETGTGGYIPTDQSINTLGADPNYGQFYNSMRNTYNVANSTKNLPPVGSSGYFSADALAQESAKKAVAQSIAESGTEAGAEAGLAGAGFWQGPAPALANMALSAIPTRDREKVDTPFGSQGSKSGMLKGAGKGALLGATVGSAVPVVGTGVGAIAGGVAGLLGGAQGYFDTTSPPTITQIGLLRGRGGQLSTPKGMYG